MPLVVGRGRGPVILMAIGLAQHRSRARQDDAIARPGCDAHQQIGYMRRLCQSAGRRAKRKRAGAAR